MKHKVAELEGALLDAAVAKAEDRDPALPVYSAHSDSERDWSPSTEWSDGGPIIERERISLTSPDDQLNLAWRNVWTARVLGTSRVSFDLTEQHGPTPMIAAMRAFVASRFGDEVELP